LSYRSGIFYIGDETKAIAEDTIEDINASGLCREKSSTELKPAEISGKRSPNTRTYLERYPDGIRPVHFHRPEWKLPVRPRQRTRPETGTSQIGSRAAI